MLGDEVDERANLWRLVTPLRVHQEDRNLRRLVISEQRDETAFFDVLPHDERRRLVMPTPSSNAARSARLLFIASGPETATDVVFPSGVRKCHSSAES